MKKTIVISILLMLCTLSLTAAPARPGRITYTQPDGTTIGIYLHGDEFYHWMTDGSGNIVVVNEEGYVVAASSDELSAMAMKKEEASIRRARNMEALRASSSNNIGSPRIPVLLVGFSDVKFTKTQAQFDAMLNTPGYSDNHAIGSVYDYYNENSFGKFTPQFDVLEPVTLKNTLSHYGSNNDALAYTAMTEAMEQLDGKVDFSKYDNDGDGAIDFVIFYYGGYDEAQCPSGSQYYKYIWSHASDVSSLGKKFDGKTVSKYFCTSELKGYSGDTMCSIGTTCHEFAHTLGLPDFYDVRYQEGLSSTESANMYSFDLMASGSYNGTYESTVPPYLNAEELMEIGWLDAIPEIAGNGSYSLPSINFEGAQKYSAYMTKTKVSNEYFVYETRGGTRWDSALPTGLLVYHVDKSTNKIQGSVTAASVWSQNYVNSYATHPCCYVIPASNPTQLSVYTGSAKYMLFGSSYKSYSPVAWDGNSSGFQLSSILYSNGTTTFSVVNSNTLGIAGKVMDSDGNPLAGVTMTVVPGSGVSNAPAKLDAGKGTSLLNKVRMLFRPSRKNRLPATRAAASYSAETDSDGSFLIEVPAGTYQVEASLNGYVRQQQTVTVTSLIESVVFYLMREGEEAPSTLYAWPTDILTEEDEYYVGASINSITGQNLYPASEIGKYAGKQIKEITFFLYGDESTTYKGVNVIIDYDSERKATVAVDSDALTVGGYTTVDLRDQELIIPFNKDVFAGVGYSEGGYLYENYYYSFGAYYKTDEDENYYDWAVGWPYDGLVSEYSLTATGERYSWDVIFDFTLTIGDYEAPDTGYNYIADPKNGAYSAGDVFALTLVETSGARKPGTDISWFLDDEAVSGTSVTLTAGAHVIEARFTTTEGKRKVVELEITAE